MLKSYKNFVHELNQ